MHYTGIIILNYNNSQMTFNCLKSLNDYIDSYCEILIVDNGSSQKEVESLKNIINLFRKGKVSNYILEIKELYLKKNLGYACGNKEGLKFFYKDKDCEDILILNNDTIFVEDILNKLKKLLWKDENIAWVMPRLINIKGEDGTAIRTKKTFIYMLFYLPIAFFNFEKLLNLLRNLKLYKPADRKLDLTKETHPIICDIMNGACFLMKKEILQKIEDFDSRTFLYFEEDILGHKVIKLNKKGYLIPSTKIIHLWRATTRKSKSFFLDMCIKDSAYIYTKYYLNPGMFSLIIFDLLVVFYGFIDWLLKSRRISDLQQIIKCFYK